MNKPQEQTRLKQARHLQWFKGSFSPTEMVPACLKDFSEDHNYGIHCALIPLTNLEQTLKTRTWDLFHNDGMPGASRSYSEGKEHVSYHRFGKSRAAEPLVIDRQFSSLRTNYSEISEEFRLFHDLYFDRKKDQYLKFDGPGNTEVIVTIKENRVDIRLKEILQYLAIKEMYLSIQFDYCEFSRFTLQDLELDIGGTETREQLLLWGLYFGEFGFGRSRAYSKLSGKRLIEPFPKEKSGFWGFAEEKEQKHVDFIIGATEYGDEIIHSANPDTLANNFGSNLGAPHFLSPVFFRKQVLDKYFQQPSKYQVADCHLACGSLWGLQLDNQNSDYVCAWLGDLGNLHFEEQLHWRSHNIAPPAQVSEVFYRRQILGQFAASERIEDKFRKRYKELQNTSIQTLNYSLLKPLEQEDMHHFLSMRIAASEEQKEFDELIISLTKILIDSLNEKELRKCLQVEENAGLKGSIAILEKVLTVSSAHDYQARIQFLRNLQDLRSSSAAHRKGSNYKKAAAKFDIPEKSLSQAFVLILEKSIDLMTYLDSAIKQSIFIQLNPSTSVKK